MADPSPPQSKTCFVVSFQPLAYRERARARAHCRENLTEIGISLNQRQVLRRYSFHKKLGLNEGR